MIIYYLKGEERSVKTLEKIFSENVSIYVSTIKELELLSFPNLTQKEESQINKFLSVVSVIPLDSRIAKIAGKLRSQYKIKLADSVIAATALYTNSILITKNIKDFKK